MKTLAYSPTLIFTPEAAAFKYWTVKEYRQISELGILDTDDRTELIEGQILDRDLLENKVPVTL